MKIISKKIVISSLIILSLAVSVQAEKTYSYFANGVGNTEEQARKSSTAIQILTGIEMERPLYNSTYGFIADALEAARQSTGLDELYKEFVGFMDAESKGAQIIQDTMEKYQSERDQKIALKAAKIYSLIDKSKKTSMEEYFKNPFSYNARLLEIGFTNFEIGRIEAMSSFSKTVEDLASVYEVVYNKLNYEKSDENTDLSLMAERLQTIIDNGDKANIFAHSQGNLMINDLLKYYMRNVDNSNVKLLSVATPNANVFGDRSGKNYITLTEDIVSWSFIGSYPGNFSNYSDLPLSEDSPWYVRYNPFAIVGWVAMKPSAMTLMNNNYYGTKGISGHNLIDCYLKEGSKSREWIKKEYLENYAELSGNDESDFSMIDSTFTPETIYADSTVRFRTTVKYGGNETISELGKSYLVFFTKSENASWKYVGYVRSDIGEDRKSKIWNINLGLLKKYGKGDYRLAVAIYNKKTYKVEDRKNNWFFENFKIH